MATSEVEMMLTEAQREDMDRMIYEAEQNEQRCLLDDPDYLRWLEAKANEHGHGADS